MGIILMEHQNWEYTVYSGGKSGAKAEKGEKAVNKAGQLGKDVETFKKVNANNKANNLVGSQIHRVMEADQYKADTVSQDFKMCLMKARQAKGLTQQQLANAINEKQSIVQEYESGRAVPNNQVISKLNRALGVKLPAQKKKKNKGDSDDA